MILFSDAVFAITITLLVIEIKIPEIHEAVSDKALFHSLGHLAPKFLGFIISFLLIGLYWTVHHRMFGYVTDYNNRLLWINLFFLFFIVLNAFQVPDFTVNILESDSFRKELQVPMTFYVLNFFGAGMMNYVMMEIHFQSETSIDKPSYRPAHIKTRQKLRSLIVPLCFLSMLPVAYLSKRDSSRSISRCSFR